MRRRRCYSTTVATTTHRLAVAGSGEVTALHDAISPGRTAFVYAPGAGASLTDPFGAHLADVLPVAGIELWRFQFPYMEAKRGGPDRPPILEATWRAVLDRVRGDGRPVVIGGRSMGGRMASHVVAQGNHVAGLALFAYPLHPPGKPEQRRDAHLSSINVPVLFCCGTRDAFGTSQELAEAAALVPGAKLHLLEGADHGFNVLKGSGRGRQDVWREASDALLTFIDSLQLQ